MTKKTAQLLGPLLEKILAHVETPGLAIMLKLESSWAELVGPYLASKTRPASVRQGLLTVTVRNAGWANELRFQNDLFLEKLDGLLGAGVIKEIRFVAGNLDDEAPPPPRKRPKAAPTPPPGKEEAP